MLNLLTGNLMFLTLAENDVWIEMLSKVFKLQQATDYRFFFKPNNLIL